MPQLCPNRHTAITQWQEAKDISLVIPKKKTIEFPMENSTGTADSKKGIVEIDVVELSVTCSAAVLIITAIGILLFYFCTTPRQRERHCRRCKRTQTVEQNQTSPSVWQTDMCLNGWRIFIGQFTPDQICSSPIHPLWSMVIARSWIPIPLCTCSFTISFDPILFT